MGISDESGGGYRSAGTIYRAMVRSESTESLISLCCKLRAFAGYSAKEFEHQ